MAIHIPSNDPADDDEDDDDGSFLTCRFMHTVLTICKVRPQRSVLLSPVSTGKMQALGAQALDTFVLASLGQVCHAVVVSESG